MVITMTRDTVGIQEQDRDMMDLTRLLRRLERNLLSDSQDSSRPRSSYERTKIGANVQYAHSLILRLEHASPSAKTREQKSRMQPALQQKRVLLKKLQNRLHELDQLENADLDSLQDTTDQQEDLLSRYAPDTSPDDKQLDTGQENTNQAKGERAADVQSQFDDSSGSTIRARRGAPQTGTEEASATGNSLSNDRARLLTANQPHSSPGTTSSVSESDKLLAHHTSEQENITSSLLSLATALKQSTLSFSDELTSSNPLIDRATASLDQNATGMEAAERRMSMLRKMTEGRGWWGRISLYGWIAALWVALILIMFVMPKLRF